MARTRKRPLLEGIDERAGLIGDPLERLRFLQDSMRRVAAGRRWRRRWHALFRAALTFVLGLVIAAFWIWHK